VPPAPPSVQHAVNVASGLPVVYAGARLGIAQTTWPFLPVTSSLLEGKARSFVEALYQRQPNVPPSASEVRELSEYLAGC
jgi:hypothetical protein